MRIVFINLHSNNFFVTDFSGLLSKRKAIDKHRFLLEYLLNKNVEIIDYISPAGSMLPSEHLKKLAHNRFVALLEAKYVFKHNGIIPNRIKYAFSTKDIKEDDVIIFYSHYYEREKDIDYLPSKIKIVDHIHFYGQEECAEFCKFQKVDHYICEVNLQKYCELYRRKYEWYHGDYINRKFSYKERFTSTTPFADRKNKAFAVGTLTYYDGKDFVECYGDNVYQPKRKMIFDNTDFLSGQVDSFISEYNEVPLKTIEPTDSAIQKIRKKIYNFKNVGQQIKYFSFDIVEKYNEYKMFVCPEDALGIYGIGIIEGMASGCAMIGWSYGVYEDIGMIGGVHYIPYDGTVDGLKSTIEYYQRPENQAELKMIADNGCRFVREQFNQTNVAEEYYTSLASLVKKVRQKDESQIENG